MNKIFAQITIFFIRIYQHTLSPDKWILSFWLKWKICKHEPHCSQYWIKVLKRYGFIPWIFYSMDRVFKCTPWLDKNYDPDHYKVIFFCSAPIWVNFLQKLNNDKRFDLVWIVTSPDKPVGRWMKVQSNIIKQTWIELNKDVEIDDFVKTPKSIKQTTSEWLEFQNWLKSKKPDYLVVIAYGKIIPIDILKIPNIAPINVHGSILPEYRGASPIQSVLLDNKEETWITVMKMSEWMDEWNIIRIQKFKIPFDFHSLNIIETITQKWPEFLNDTLWDFGKWDIKDISQEENKATYCKKISKEDGKINIFQDSLDIIFRKYKWYYLWPKIWFIMDQKFGKNEWKRVIIENMEIDQNLFEENKNKAIFSQSWLNKSIQKIILKPEWKKPMEWKIFWNNFYQK